MFEMASSGTPNILATTAGYASLTGVVVLPGIEAPSAARSPLIMRPYDQELLTCQRYYQFNGSLMGHWQENISSQAQFSISFAPAMRAPPTVITLATANRISRPGIGTYNIGASPSVPYTTNQSIFLDVNTATAIANVPAFLLYGTFAFDARL